MLHEAIVSVHTSEKCLHKNRRNTWVSEVKTANNLPTPSFNMYFIGQQTTLECYCALLWIVASIDTFSAHLWVVGVCFFLQSPIIDLIQYTCSPLCFHNDKWGMHIFYVTWENNCPRLALHIFEKVCEGSKFRWNTPTNLPNFRSNSNIIEFL